MGLPSSFHLCSVVILCSLPPLRAAWPLCDVSLFLVIVDQEATTTTPKTMTIALTDMLRGPFKARSNDDDSLSSTVTVDKDQVKSAFQVTVQRSCRVVINEAANVEHPSDVGSKDELKERWYSSEEMRLFRSTTMFMAREISKSELRNRAPFSYERVMRRTYDVCCETIFEVASPPLSSDERKHLNRWSEVATSRLGLERYCVRSIQLDKMRRRRLLTEIVLGLDGDVDETDPDALSKACSRISRASRLFAQAVGESQAAAVVQHAAS